MKTLMGKTGLAAVLAIGIGVGIAAGYGIGSITLEERMRAVIADNPQLIIESIEAGREAQQRAALRAVTDAEGNDGWDKITTIGNPDGDVTIYEFSDYNCGFCKRSLGVLTELLESDGNIRLVVREFPILSEDSLLAARYALAVAREGKFDEFHVALMGRPGRVDATAIEETIAAIGLDKAALDAAIEDEAIADAIDANRETATRLGIGGTPAFIIGDTLIPGAAPLEEMQRVVNEAREAAGL